MGRATSVQDELYKAGNDATTTEEQTRRRHPVCEEAALGERVRTLSARDSRQVDDLLAIGLVAGEVLALDELLDRLRRQLRRSTSDGPA